MADPSPEEAARLSERIKNYFNNDKVLPFEYKEKARKKVRELERNANMRAADKALHQAVRYATDEQMSERMKKIGEARRYFAKACMLGAEDEWRKAFDRLAETALMTGGVHHAGPSRAKPLDIAPRAPNRAKA
jgi:uncharacterized protein YpuA (DUF1002 family)